MRWQLAWLTVLLMASVSPPLPAQENASNPQANLKWAQGVGKEFLDAVGSGEFELADSLISESFRAAMKKSKKEGLREWLSKNAANKALAKRKVQSAEISPDGNEVAISGVAWATDSTSHTFSLRLVKHRETSEWEVRYFNISTDAVAAAKPAPIKSLPAKPAAIIKKAEPPPKVVKPHERVLGKIPESFVVSSYVTYKAGKMADVQITTNGHATGLIDVVVNQPKQDVVLLLVAYEPTIWRISHTPETRIVGVVASGYHQQEILGIDRDVKRAISTYDGPGSFPRYASGYDDGPDQEKLLSRFAQITLGKEVSTFGQQRGRGIVGFGEVPDEDTKLISSTKKKVEDLAVEGSMLPGEKGLDLLVKEGKLRPATQDDIDAWRELAFKRNTSSAARPGPYLSADRAYVMLKETPLPPGLSGANSRSFLVPKGIAIHRGSQQHCSFYIMDGTEYGLGARN